MKGNHGIGVISDNEDQPILVSSHLGTYSLVTVGVIHNIEKLAARACRERGVHFAEMSGGEVNPTEMVATLIHEEATFEDGIRNAQESIEGSCSMLLLTAEGVYAARDRLGRTPVILGRKDGAYAVTMETTAFPNLGFEPLRDLGPGEVVFLTADGVEPRLPALSRLQICGFLWVYYGYPSSAYEGINVEIVRNRCGAALARKDNTPVDLVAGIPDSGTGHAIGYAAERGLPYRRPFVKYTPTWPRSFMPQDQSVRDLVARMKLIPIPNLIEGRRLLFCEDSIVRGTQLKDIIERIYACGAREIHMRPACPPLIAQCKFLNFSRSRSEMDLAGRKAIHEIEGDRPCSRAEYAAAGSEKYCAMVERIRQRLNLTTLKYQTLDDLVQAIGLPKEKVCTYCWDGAE
jgi:amidophosphoribosyltransferase